MKKILLYGKFFLGWPLSVLALLFIFRFIDTRIDTIQAHISAINWLLLSYGIVSYFIFYALRCLLWREILIAKGHSLRLQDSSFMWAQAEIKRFVPGFIWSMLGRTLLFTRNNIKTKTVLSGMATEIHVVMLSSLFLALFSAPFILKNFSPAPYYTNLLILLTFAFFALTYFFFLHSRFSSKIKHLIPTERLWMLHDIVFSPLPFKIQIKFFLIGLLTFLFFGLGTYLVAAASVVLSAPLTIQLVCFFVFSYFIGYISVIAPLGLGVREGIITVGLSYLMPIETAAFVAISSRVIFVATELLFLLAAYGWKSCRGAWYSRAENWTKRNKALIIVLTCITMYIGYFAPISLLRYDNYYTGRFDLGNMDQTVWNTFRGRVFELTDPDGTQIISRLGFHADFILILLAPLYHLWADPRVLLLVQTILLGFGALFVFLIGKQVLKSPRIALFFSLAYLLNPAVQHTNLYDFHGVTLATSLLLGAFYFLCRHRYYLFLIFAVLAALCKEEIWLIFAIFGLFIAFYHGITVMHIKRKTVGLILFFIGLAVFYVLIAHVIPAFRGGQHFALSYYSDFGDSPLAILKNIIFSPVKTFSILTQNGRLVYLWQIFFPLGFLSLAAPHILLFTLPDFFINLLSNNGQLHQIHFQYTATITPFIFVAAIYGVKNMTARYPMLKTYVPWYMLTCTLIASYFFGPLPYAKNPNVDMIYKPLPHKEEIESFVSHIKKRYSIAATNNIGSHLSRRQRIYTIPIGVRDADYVLFLLNDVYAQPSPEAQQQMVAGLMQDPGYTVAFKQGDFIAFRKKTIPK